MSLIRKVLADAAFRRAVIIVSSLRVALGLLGPLSILVSPIRNANGAWISLVTPQSSPLWAILSPWQRFDALWYEHIANNGYGADGATAFCPLLPGLMRGIGYLFLGNTALAGIVISTISLVVALTLLFHLLNLDLTSRAAQRATLYIAIAPTAFFFFAAYTESLFLAFSVAAFFMMRKRRWAWASFFIAVACLCRIQGLLLFVPFVVEAWVYTRSLQGKPWRPFGSILSTLSIPLVFFISQGVLFHIIEAPGFGPLSAEQGWGVHLEPPWRIFSDAMGVIISGKHPEEVLNLGVSLLLLAVLPVMWKRLPKSYTFYVAANALLIWFHENRFSPLMSASRFALVLFPLFALLAMTGTKRREKYVFTFFPLLLALLFIGYVHFHFIG